MPLDLDRVAFAQREYRTTIIEDLTVQSRHPLAVELDYNTLISSESDAQAFGLQVLELRKQDRDTWTCLVNKQNYSLEVGDTVRVVYPRFNLEFGGDFIVKRVKRDSNLLYDELSLFGPNFFRSSPNFTLTFTPGTPDFSKMTFSRSSAGSYVNSAGVIVSASNDVPRIDHHPVTATVLGLLVEESRVNAVRYSSDFSNALWTRTALNLSANSLTSPDAAAGADLLARSSTSVSAYAQQSLTYTVGQTVTMSVYAKAGTTGGRLGLRVQGTYPDRADAVFDLQNGAIVGTNAQSYTGVSARIEPAGFGFYRCSVTATVAGTNVVSMVLGPTDSTKSVASWEAASSVLSDAYVWGAQAEVGAFPTSYIETTSAAVTRAADQARVDGTAFSSIFNQSEGTFLLDYYDSEAVISSRILGFSSSHAALLISNATQIGAYWGSAPTYCNVTVGSIRGPNTAAVAYSSAGSSVSANGGTVTSNSSITLLTHTAMWLGSLTGTSNFLNGHLRRVWYFPYRLDDDEIKTLSAR